MRMLRTFGLQIWKGKLERRAAMYSSGAPYAPFFHDATDCENEKPLCRRVQREIRFLKAPFVQKSI